MPNHVHLLLSEPAKGTPSTVIKMLKQRVSHKMREHGFREHPHFWQARFYDFNVYSYGKTKEKLDYMHANAATRGLVKDPKDWPWSSFSFYATGEQGLMPVDAVNV